jgi:Flp pilus assembly protein TadD
VDLGGFPGLAVLLVTGLALGGCQTTQSSSLADTMTTGSIGDPSIRQTAEAGMRWRANPGDARAGLEYARQLDALGRGDEQLSVLDEVARRNPNDVAIQAYYGKQLASRGRAEDAQRVLQRLVDTGKADWKVHSALGSTLDQLDRHAEARRQYELALQMKPDDFSILNNLGMSYLLEGDLHHAEATFREADALPSSASDTRLRQNLALSVGLQGRFDEARQIASRDLPPEQVEANLAYLKGMLSRPNTWQQLQANKPQT